MRVVLELVDTDAGLRGELTVPGRPPMPFAGWLEFLALIEQAAAESDAAPGPLERHPAPPEDRVRS